MEYHEPTDEQIDTLSLYAKIRNVSLDVLCEKTGLSHDEVLENLQELAGRGVIRWQKVWNE